KSGVLGSIGLPLASNRLLKPSDAAVTVRPVIAGAGNCENMPCVAADASASSCGVGAKKPVLTLPRTFSHSADPKKKVLSLMTGPPAEKPNWLRLKNSFGKPFAL